MLRISTEFSEPPPTPNRGRRLALPATPGKEEGAAGCRGFFHEHGHSTDLTMAQELTDPAPSDPSRLDSNREGIR